MQKKLAVAPAQSSNSSTAGVTSGSGPSSKHNPTCPSRALSSGRRVRLGPSRPLRGHRPSAPSNAWLPVTAPRAHGQAAGTAAAPTAATACSAIEPRVGGGGFQGRRAALGGALQRGGAGCRREEKGEERTHTGRQ